MKPTSDSTRRLFLQKTTVARLTPAALGLLKGGGEPLKIAASGCICATGQSCGIRCFEPVVIPC
ncbi:class I lanthipeptide [Chitinophaga nivalis]